MELREFAEQVLFGSTLEEKLHCPEVITDDRPGAPVMAPPAPGRPPALRFRAQGSARPNFPGVHSLERERERGRLLHFFGNHELLATELMALALLRFPDAPPAFRRGVFQTLKDEQDHTRLYMERMKSCGVEFGEIPVSGFFWRCVAPMEHPIDYIATLCLTFEQANLDFAGHFASCFQEVGDAETARLLHRIQQDEIGHVAYGLKWFRRWKNANEDDWDAFCRVLKFPLSPQRAKGFSLNVEARREAGLDAAFIAKLDVYSQSKGRTPNVFVFNPFAEGYISGGRSFNPPKHQAQLGADLANLPQFLCRSDDVVLVPRQPSVEFLSSVKSAGFALPEFVEFSAANSLTRRKLGRLYPWAWGPDSVEMLSRLFPCVGAEARTAQQHFNEGIAELYSKAWSAGFLAKFLQSHPQEPWLCGQEEVGVVANSVAAALDAIAAIRSRGQHKVVVKQALGVAGSNALRLWEPDLLEPQLRWITAAIEQGKGLVVEPWLEREADFSVQLEMTPCGLRVCGYTGLINDFKGQFQANVAAPNHRRQIPSKIIALFREPRDIFLRVHHLYENVMAALEKELRQVGFLGPLGIDAFVYRTPDGLPRLKPVVEINPRYTMGRLTVELMRQAAPGSEGLFRLVSVTQLRGQGFQDFTGYARFLLKSAPLILEGHPEPRIREGVICLNDPEQVRVCLATFHVGRPARATVLDQSG